jgi:four helix bundle protein
MASHHKCGAPRFPCRVISPKGRGIDSDLEFVRFLFHARGSLLELQTQVLIARRLHYLPEDESDELSRSGDVIARGLNALINKFRPKAA